MLNYNLDITVIRTGPDGDTGTAMRAIDGGADTYYLPVDADIQEGDQVERLLPSGQVRTVYITNVNVLQSPFGSNLDHTEAHYCTSRPAKPVETHGSVVNVTGHNVQIATGNLSSQTMSVGTSLKELIHLTNGIAELLVLAGAVDAGNADLVRSRDSAIVCINEDKPDKSAVKRFAEWVVEQTKVGAGPAVSAAIGAAVSSLLHGIGA